MSSASISNPGTTASITSATAVSLSLGSWDVQVADIAARAAYNSGAAGFSVLVSDTGSGRAAVYTKNSATSGDWSDPAYYTGPTGATGATGPAGADGIDGADGADGNGFLWRAQWALYTDYAINDVAFNNDVSYVCVAAHTADNNDEPGVGAGWDAKWDVFNYSDMLASIYDPTGVGDDAFSMDNMVEGADTKIMTAAERAKIARHLSFDAVSDLLNDSTLAYSFGSPTVSAGEIISAGGFRYEVAASGASDNHIVTSGGVKLYVIPGDEGYNLRAFGAVGNAKRVSATLSITSGSASLTATGGTFAASDVGKVIAVPGAGAAGATLLSTIAGYTSSSAVTLADNASTTLSAVSGTIAYGTDDTDAAQAWLDAIPSSGGSAHAPSGNYTITTRLSRTMNSGGVNGWAVRITSDSRGNTTWYGFLAAGTHTMQLVASTAFSGGHTIKPGRFLSAVDGDAKGLKLCGITFSTIELSTQENSLGLETEACLVNIITQYDHQSKIGAYCRPSGYFSGAWPASGCNVNRWYGSYNQCSQYAFVAETFQSLKWFAHVERCGSNDIANGGVSDTDRGGLKLIDPEGVIDVAGTFEDCGDVEGGHEGKGPVYVSSTASNVGINWTLYLNGTYFKRTGDGPKSIVYANNNASAGVGRIHWSGAHLENNGSYGVSASNPIFNLTGSNMEVIVIGGYMDGGSTEFAYSSSYSYVVSGLPEITPGGLWQHFELPAGGTSNPFIFSGSGTHTGDTSETTLASFTIPADVLGANGHFETDEIWTGTNVSAGTKTGKTKLSTAVYGSLTFTTSLAYRASRLVFNDNSASSQIGGPVGGTGGFGAGSAAVTSSVNTASDATVTFTGQLTDSSEEISVRYRAAVYYKA